MNSNGITNGHSTTNGVPDGHPASTAPKPLTPEEMRAKTKELRIVNRYKRTLLEAHAISEASVSLRESYSVYGGDQGFGFGGTDMSEVFMRAQNQAGGGIPPAQPNDRRGGRKWPLWQTDVQRNRLLQQARILCAVNDYAKGLLRNNTNYTIGKGFGYTCGVKDDKPFEVVEGEEQPLAEARRKDFLLMRRGAKKVADAVQRWIDDFCARNNWNTAAASNDVSDDGSVAAASSTKERESHWRVDRDGEAMIRLFGQDDGTVITRFVGPEVVWGAPPNESERTGWTFGMQHAVVEEENDDGSMKRSIDLGRIKAYYVRFHAMGEEVEGKDNSGSVVPAAEIIHIKDPWEDAEVKRGTSAFAYDCGDALLRAANLQRNISITSSVQAATAEIWKHTIGTKQSIEQMAAGLPGVRPGIGGMMDDNGRITQRVIPGQVRRVPAGQEPVPDPATTQVPNYMQAAQGDLRQAASGMSAPEYLVSSDASNSNFASTQEAGTPYVRASESRQEHFKTAFLRLMWRVVRYAVKMGKLPQEALTLVSINVEGMEIHKNNEGELAQARTANLAAKVTSPQIEIAKLGNDVAQVKADWKEWDKDMAPAQGAPGAPPGGAPPGGGPPGAPPGGEVPPEGAQEPAGDPNDPLAGVPQEDLSAEFARQGGGDAAQVQESRRAARLNWINVPAEILDAMHA